MSSSSKFRRRRRTRIKRERGTSKETERSRRLIDTVMQRERCARQEDIKRRPESGDLDVQIKGYEKIFKSRWESSRVKTNHYLLQLEET